MVAERLPVGVSSEDGDTVIVAADGEPWPAGVAARLPRAVVVAADGGARHAQEAGVAVAHVVGDFDSLAEGPRRALEQAGAALHAYPADKDFTDLELAIEHALAILPGSAGRVLVVGGHGGRVDHFLANAALLSAPRWAREAPRARLEAWVGHARLLVVRGGQAAQPLDGPVGTLVSLLPQHGPAVGVVTAGLQYPLRGEDLEPGSSRGVSNVIASVDAAVSLAAGTLLVVQPSPVPPPEEQPA